MEGKVEEFVSGRRVATGCVPFVLFRDGGMFVDE